MSNLSLSKTDWGNGVVDWVLLRTVAYFCLCFFVLFLLFCFSRLHVYLFHPYEILEQARILKLQKLDDTHFTTIEFYVIM